MGSNSEKSFGARLRRAQDMNAYITNYAAYAPPRGQESVIGFTALLDSIVAANSGEVTVRQAYNTVVSLRYKAFRTDAFSVFKVLTKIRGAVISQYGEDSIEFNQVDGNIKKIRSSKLGKTLASDGSELSRHSTSHQSYGSSTQYFTDLVDTLKTFSAYNPSRTELKIAQLETFAEGLTLHNDAVANAFKKLKDFKTDRAKLYDILSDSAKRIKAYVKSEYGIDSNEFKLIKGLAI